MIDIQEIEKIRSLEAKRFDTTAKKDQSIGWWWVGVGGGLVFIVA